jgi:hypothetical protein
MVGWGYPWERYLQSGAEMHFQELSAITYELLAGRTKYSPTRELVDERYDMV